MSAPAAEDRLTLPRAARVGLDAVRATLPRRDRLRSGPWTPDALLLLSLVGLLLLVGLVLSLSASLAADSGEREVFTTFGRQLVWAGIGAALMAAAARVDHRVWRGLAWPLLAGAVVGLLLLFLPGVGLERDGSTRWLSLGPLTVQPSEAAKPALMLVLADAAARKLARHGPGGVPLRHHLVPALPLLAVVGTLVLLQPDLGTTLLLAYVVGLVLFFAGLPARWLVGGAAVTAVLAVVLIRVADYRSARITGWLDAEANAGGAGYQLIQSRIALGSGGWTGLGLGSSRGKWDDVPNPETDFIFAILGEELGLLGALAVLGLFTALLLVGLRIARGARDPFGRIVAATVPAFVVGQAMLNVGTVTGLLPITGVPLPLVSVGGSSLVTTLLALGILLSVARARPGPGDDLPTQEHP